MSRQSAHPVNDEGRQGFDLLRLIRPVVVSPVFPYLIQAMFLLVFVWLAVLGFGRVAPEGVPDKLYAKTNLVNLTIWGLWWPAMVWVAVCFGRIWCTVCPLELVANGTERLGRGLGLEQRVLGKWLRSGVLILGLYALIQLLVAGIHLHRVPAYTSIFLWGMLLLAALSGFFFKDRAFCRGFCPVGLLLGTYGRGAMLAVRPIWRQTCDACTEKDCVAAANRDRLDARSCPSLLNPAKLDSNTDCLVCLQCVKACRPANVGLFLRRPFHGADAREALAAWPVTLFVILVSGFISYELCTEWDVAKAAFLWVPQQAAKMFGLAADNGWVKGIWTLAAFPTLLWIGLGVLVMRCRGADTLLEAWRRLALPLAVVISAGHMAKGLAKVNSWGGYLPLALADPMGPDNAVGIHTGTIVQPGKLVDMHNISVAAVGLIAGMCLFALRESRLSDPVTHRARVPAILIVTLVMAFIAFGWGFLS